MWDLSSPTRDRSWVPCTGRQFLNHWTTGKSPAELLLREFFVLFLQCFCKVENFFQNINKKVWVPSTPWPLTASRSASHCSEPCVPMNPLTRHSQREAGLTLVPGLLTGKLRPGLGFGLGTTGRPPQVSRRCFTTCLAPSLQTPFSKMT